MLFVRGFGLHDPERTPCGQPMSVSEAHALTELARRPQLRQRELGECLQLEKSTVSRLVGQLVTRGWIERTPAADDGRAVSLDLTARGARLATQVQEARRRRCESLLAAMPAVRREQIVAAMHLLTEALHAEQKRN